MEATLSATVTRKPDHRQEHEISRKPSRAGTPGESGCNRGDYARVLYFNSHARLRVQWHPAFPTPSLGESSCTTRAYWRRGNAELYLAVVARSDSDEAIY